MFGIINYSVSRDEPIEETHISYHLSHEAEGVGSLKFQNVQTSPTGRPCRSSIVILRFLSGYFTNVRFYLIFRFKFW